MPPPEDEQEQERASFDDDEELDDTEGDDSDMDDDDGEDDGDDADAVEAPPPPVTISAGAGGEDINSSTPSTSTSSDRTLNPNPNPISNPNPSNPPSAPQNGAITVLPLSTAVPIAAGANLFTPSPDQKRQRTEDRRPPLSVSFDESRRLFQRLWTDDDEIKILKGFLEFTSQRGTTFASHQYDTGPFYEQIKNQLQLDFTKNQLIEKLRRLKKKYRNTANRMVNHGKDFTYKSPHEKAIYEIARKIWSASIKRSRDSDDDDFTSYANANNISDAAVISDRGMSRSRRRGRKRSLETMPVAVVTPPPPPPAQAMPPPPPLAVAAAESSGVVKVEVQTVADPIPSSSSAAQIPTIVEETVKSCLSPIFKELFNSTAPCGPLGLGNGGGVLGLSPPLMNFGLNSAVGNSSGCSGSVDEKWKTQQILELEVYLKRVELVRDQIKSTLEELRSPPPPPAASTS